MNDIDAVFNRVKGIQSNKYITIEPNALETIWGEPMSLHTFRMHLAKIKSTRGMSFKTKTDKRSGRIKVMRID
jgi:hypothetical protein